MDAPIASLCSKINSQSGIYTTSSCSGRISVFAEPDSLSRSQGKKGGEWVYASHDRAVEEEVLARIMDRKAAGSLVLRFEPFILHAECRTLDEASRVLLAARNAGYRESGATLGNRVMLAIRCSLRLEVPVADGGEMLVPESYLRYLIRLANEKFKENEDRVMKLEAQLDLIWGRTDGPSEPHPSPSPVAIIANRKGQLQVTKAFRQSQGLDVVPTRPRNSSEGSVDPRKLLLGRQLSILKRIKALEKLQLSSPESIGSRREDLTLPVVQEESSRREDPPLPVFQSESKEMSKDPGLHWNELLLDSEKTSPSVSRWGHASVLLPNGSICIIGGYGGHGVTHTRMADVVVISMSREVGEGKAVGQMKVAQTRAADDGQGVMQARQGHSATLIDESRILVVGGRSSPAE